MSGYEGARAARGAADGRRPVLVALTGYGAPEDRERALAAGFDEHLVKPVDLDVLKALLARLS
jgi:CheY-like chemotaxis protein